MPAGRTRYTVVVANRSTGAVRRLTVAKALVLVIAFGVVTLPVWMGLTARYKVFEEVADLETRSVALEIENTSYRATAERLMSQLSSLQAAVDEIHVKSDLSPEEERAMARLPARVRERAVGGGTVPADMASTVLLGSLQASPEDVFGRLGALLDTLQDDLAVVEGHVERRAALAAATPTVWPINGSLSERFGPRTDPFTGEEEFHSGLDISADRGVLVHATADGVVASAKRNGPYGNQIVVDHGFGIATRYGHLSKFLVKAGQTVHRGQAIGEVGSTGRATGPHLHYEVLVNDRFVNPLQLLFTRLRK